MYELLKFALLRGIHTACCTAQQSSSCLRSVGAARRWIIMLYVMHIESSNPNGADFAALIAPVSISLFYAALRGACSVNAAPILHAFDYGVACAVRRHTARSVNAPLE